MEAETGRKIEEMVLDILKKANIEETTEFTIRVAASERLGIDLSNSPAKHFVRTIIESYLLSIANGKPLNGDDKPLGEPEVVKPIEEPIEALPVVVKRKNDDSERLICQLSNRRNVVVQNFKGTTLVSIREFYNKDGKQFPGSKGISLNAEQWSAFKRNVPALEEAIAKMEGRIKSEINGKQNEDASNSVVDVAPPEVVPIEVIRFDGKNYQFWTQQMELLLKQLRIEYVLTELCPNARLGEDASAEDIAAAKSAERRWVNDDLMCHRNILNHLSDHLFNQYVSRKMSAKELWEDLRLVYLYEEFGTKRSQVKKYIEFQMVEEKPINDQIHELNGIADSIVAAGILIDDNFHTSVIISKLPPSWKEFCIKLMREEYLPFWKLMERIQREEESRSGPSDTIGFNHASSRWGLRGLDTRPPPGFHHRHRSEMNSRSIPCCICGKRGHLSKNCWRRYDKQANEEDSRMPTEDTPGVTQ
ncbi:hypothetical protein RJT34_20557 [Clitoria ternatea]|uniref:CCHC-type domain-containing protein n=1 Tax=Clitoria ternatea TaxID=43366 RepID=A0AAN9ITF3_CLITE